MCSLFWHSLKCSDLAANNHVCLIRNICLSHVFDLNTSQTHQKPCFLVLYLLGFWGDSRISTTLLYWEYVPKTSTSTERHTSEGTGFEDG